MQDDAYEIFLSVAVAQIRVSYKSWRPPFKQWRSMSFSLEAGQYIVVVVDFIPPEGRAIYIKILRLY